MTNKYMLLRTYYPAWDMKHCIKIEGEPTYSLVRKVSDSESAKPNANFTNDIFLGAIEVEKYPKGTSLLDIIQGTMNGKFHVTSNDEVEVLDRWESQHGFKAQNPNKNFKDLYYSILKQYEARSKKK